MKNILLRVWVTAFLLSGSEVWEGLCTAKRELWGGIWPWKKDLQRCSKCLRENPKQQQRSPSPWFAGVAVSLLCHPGSGTDPWADPHSCRRLVAPDNTGWSTVHPICVSGTFIWARQQTHSSAALCFTSSLKSLSKETSLCYSLTSLFAAFSSLPSSLCTKCSS